MIASDNPARKTLWEFGVQRTSEDKTHPLGALSLCEYLRFTIIAPNQVHFNVHLGRVGYFYVVFSGCRCRKKSSPDKHKNINPSAVQPCKAEPRATEAAPKDAPGATMLQGLHGLFYADLSRSISSFTANLACPLLFVIAVMVYTGDCDIWNVERKVGL